jgi:hypothetical protein
VYVNGKMVLETISRMGVGGLRRIVEGVNSSMVYLTHYKSFCKCHNVPTPSTTVEKKNASLISAYFVHFCHSLTGLRDPTEG